MRKLSQFEAKILIEALQDTLKKQLGNYIDNIREIRTMLDSETRNYPPKLKGRTYKYYSLLDEVQAMILGLKERANNLLDNFPAIEAWSLSNVQISGEDFDAILEGEGISTKMSIRGSMLMWDSDRLSIYSEKDPHKNGNMGTVYLLGNELAIKGLISKIKKHGSVAGEERDVAIPLAI